MEHITAMYRALDYPDYRSFLVAYGYCVEQKASGRKRQLIPKARSQNYSAAICSYELYNKNTKIYIALPLLQKRFLKCDIGKRLF